MFSSWVDITIRACACACACTCVQTGPLPPSVIKTCPGELKELCKLPQFDPIVGQASLTCLALALAGVASSLRVFGTEKVVFRRETITGTSTEVCHSPDSACCRLVFGCLMLCGAKQAYFLGKNVAHIPTILLAPLMFLAMYYQVRVVWFHHSLSSALTLLATCTACPSTRSLVEVLRAVHLGVLHILWNGLLDFHRFQLFHCATRRRA